MAGLGGQAGSRRRREGQIAIRVVKGLQHHQAYEGIGIVETGGQVQGPAMALTRCRRASPGDPAPFAASSRLSPPRSDRHDRQSPLQAPGDWIHQAAGTGMHGLPPSKRFRNVEAFELRAVAPERPDKADADACPFPLFHTQPVTRPLPNPTRAAISAADPGLLCGYFTASTTLAMTPCGGPVSPNSRLESCPVVTAFDQAEIERCFATGNHPAAASWPAVLGQPWASCRALVLGGAACFRTHTASAACCITPP